MSLRSALGLADATRGELALFGVPALLSIGLAAAGIRYPSVVGAAFSRSFDWVLNYFGWWFILLSVLLTLGLTAFSLSRYGHLRIGGPDATPAFGRFSWLSMVFTVGYSIAVLFWGVAEPVYILQSPPEPSPVPGASTESLALAFTYLHDILPGLIAWYLPFAIAFGVIVWDTDDWRVSTILTPLLNRDRYASVYWVVDLLSLVAIVGGLATSLGFIGRQLSAIVSVVYGVESQLLTIGLFVGVAALFLLDVWLGLERGIRNAARIAVVANVVATVALFVLGPSLFIVELGLDAMGVWLNNLPRLMLYTDPVERSLWPQNWTSFWWAWWASWGVFVGSFVARVSRGRTVREVFLGLCIVPTTLLVFQHAVLGGLALAPGNTEIVADALASGGNAAALSAAITLVPYAPLVGALLVVALIGYIVTSLDSAVYMLAAINTGDRVPNARIRATWGVLMLAIGVMTTYLGGGTRVLESFSTTLALPFTVLYAVVLYAVYVYVQREVNWTEYAPWTTERGE